MNIRHSERGGENRSMNEPFHNNVKHETVELRTVELRNSLSVK
jgi:hypothetical protein